MSDFESASSAGGPYPATFEEISAAWELLKPLVRSTPTMTCAALSERAGRSLLFKCEYLQKTGSFKVRGATHAALRAKEKGFTKLSTHSSGMPIVISFNYFSNILYLCTCSYFMQATMHKPWPTPPVHWVSRPT